VDGDTGDDERDAHQLDRRGIWVSTMTPRTVAVAGSRDTISA